MRTLRLAALLAATILVTVLVAPVRAERSGPAPRLRVAGDAPACLSIMGMRALSPATFEDIYGPSGAKFQAALGFRISEGSTATGDAQTSYGVAVDDMVVQWREFKLVEDGSNCATSGACAAVSTDSSTLHEGNGSLGITVVDGSPYDPIHPVNDCNQDGDFDDVGTDDQDCNDNGTTDVIVRATSSSEQAGKLVVLDRAGATDRYRGTLAISTVTSAAGVLHFTDAGAGQPEITIRYADRWDGSPAGIECRASANPAEWGSVSTGVDIAVAATPVMVVRYRILDASGSGTPPLPAGQDGDGFPDTNETVDLFLTVKNPTAVPFTNLVVQLATSDPKIDCILSPVTSLGSVPARSTVDLPAPFRFKVASTADRSGTVPAVACTAGKCSNGAGACSIADTCKKLPGDRYSATIDVLLAADQFDAPAVPQSLEVEIDLNTATVVQATSVFAEGFESGLGNMTLQFLDAGIASNTLSDGRRCQYSDPDFIGSNTYGNTECYLGFNPPQGLDNDWHLHDTTSAEGGRAYEGRRSLHYAIETPGNPAGDTYAMAQMDAIRTKNAITLAARICRDDPAANRRACNTAADCISVGGGPCVSANPELSFKQQISAMDSRTGTAPPGFTADRGVVQAQLLAAGAVWEKIEPYQNVYDAQTWHGLDDCMFDPIDDGNTEDDFFDPADPQRRFGPSSTCYPEFVFAYLGDTDGPFAATNIGRASDGPGLQGSLGIGTWVESKFDLSRFRGRAIRLRWLFTSIRISSDTRTWEALFHWNPNPNDDGWFVDDVRMTQTLGASEATVTQDTTDNSALPACGSACTTLGAVLTATPPAIASPGLPILLSTAGSFADRCIGGALLSEFWIDGDANGSLGDPTDVLLRPAAIDPLFVEAPLVTTRYGARVRCSSAPAPCTDTQFTVVTVGCPGAPGAYNGEAWWANLRFANPTTLTTPSANQTVDAARGDLGALRASGSFGGAICLADGSTSPVLVDAATPQLGEGYYYLLRGADSACNENRSWSTFSPRESPADPSRRDNQITACSP